MPSPIADEAREAEKSPDHPDGECIFGFDGGDAAAAHHAAEGNHHDQWRGEVIEHGTAAQQVAEVLLHDGAHGTGEIEGGPATEFAHCCGRAPGRFAETFAAALGAQTDC